MNRRTFLQSAAAPLILAHTELPHHRPRDGGAAGRRLGGGAPGRLKQGVTRGVFGRGVSLEDCCRRATDLGIVGFDLIGPADWPTLKKYGLVPSMYPGGPGGTIPIGPSHKDTHADLIPKMHAAIDEAAANGVPNVIVLGGEKRGISNEEGADNCVAYLDAVKAHAEDKGVTLCFEYLNSKVNHKDYVFDHLAWGVDVMTRVNSPRVKILFDIYHAQIMDGDIVRNIRDNVQRIGHFHTGGNPGRHEIDDTQELNYHFVMKAIADLGYSGFVTHEYSPAEGHDPIDSLKKAMDICTV
jgi:hydroxypyruvate isomerase